MLEEALMYLREKFLEGANLTVVKELSDEKQVAVFVAGSAEPTFIDKPERPILGQVADLESLVRLTEKLSKPEFFVGELGITLHCEEHLGTPLFHTMPLDCTDEFGFLRLLKKSAQYTAREFLKTLRVHFHLTDTSSLQKIVSTIDWSNAASASEKHSRTSTSIGKSLESKVTSSVDSIPDTFTVSAQVFEQIPHRTNVKLYLEPLPDVSQFLIGPLPGQIENAVRDTLHYAENHLDTYGPSGTKIYRGKFKG